MTPGDIHSRSADHTAQINAALKAGNAVEVWSDEKGVPNLTFVCAVVPARIYWKAKPISWTHPRGSKRPCPDRGTALVTIVASTSPAWGTPGVANHADQVTFANTRAWEVHVPGG